ncbi:mutagen-sensitive 101 isoform X4 [Dermacentor variabilis]|uniref:mutagen-sensitive 101 isoform X4 n=1 Tax=Dermacentor variabilis TaxID=34621 RepID=UPI003F5C791A
MSHDFPENGDVGSKKYHVAANRKIPVMQPSWVRLFWEQEQHKLAHAASPAYSHLRLPAFKGLVITVSQVPTAERKQLQALVESNGGSYSGQLHCKKTTHVALLEASGDKYSYARLWKLHCVHVRWLYESAQAGYALDESLYALEPADVCKKSTPNRSCADDALPSWDCSVIKTEEATHINDTARSNESILTLREVKLKDPVDDIDIDKLSSCCGQFLDGCCVLLWGFAQEKLEKMRKVINACGGVRLDEYKEEVTHVVAAEGAHFTSEIMKMIKRHGGSPYVVSARWFAESCASGKLQKIDTYLLAELHSDVGGGELPANCMPNTIETHRKSVILECENPFPTDLSDIVEQYRVSNNGSMNVGDGASTLHHEKNDATISACNIEKTSEALDSLEASMKNSNMNEKLLERYESADALFTGMLFRIHDFKKEDELILEEYITHNGGKIYDDSASKGRQQLIEIVPLVIEPKNYSSLDGILVTYCWLEACVHKESLLPFEEDPLFRPFTKPATKDFLHGCVISFSQYSKPERDFLVHLAESLGATCQEFLVRSVRRNNQRNLLPNTHLIAREPEGTKFEAAVNWGLPVVTKDWLVASAKRGEKMNEDMFLLSDAAHQPFSAKPSSFRNLNALNQNGSYTGKHGVQLDNQNSITILPDKESEPFNMLPRKESTRQASEACGAQMSASHTPSMCCKEPGSFIVHDPSFANEHTDNAVDERSKIAAAEPARLLCTPDEKRTVSAGGLSTPGSFLKSQRIRELLSESHNSMSSSLASAEASSEDESFQQSIDATYRPKLNITGIEGNWASKENMNTPRRSRPLSLGKQIARNFDQILEQFGVNEDLNGLLDSPSPGLQTGRVQGAPPASFPLAGAIVCVSKRLSHVQKELGDIVRELGGEFISAYSDHCTHIVHQSKPGEAVPREVLRAREQGKTLVSSGWVYACKGSGSWLDEADFPSAHDERLSLVGHVSTVRVPKQRSQQSASSQLGSPKPLKSPPCGEIGLPKASQSTELQPRRLTESQQKINDQLDELMMAAKAAGRRQSLRPAPAPIVASPIHPVLTGTDSTKPSVITSLPLPDSESQFVAITWDDPTRRMEMARLAGKLAEMEPASQPATEQSPDGADDNVFEEAEPVVELPPKVFVISGFSDEQKIRYASIISKLNGVLLTSKAYNPEMTHLVLLQALKNERYLAALAAGKFVLHAAYLDESAKAGKFLDEEEYEWGGPLTESCLMNLSTASTKSHKGKGQQAFAPRRWRQHIAQDTDHKGAFSNWRVAVYASASKEAAYVNILTAGGATIVPTTTVCAGLEAGEITHALFDSGMAKGVQLDLLVTAGALCLKAEYMATFLVDDPVPPPEKFYIPEVVKLLDISVSTNSSTSASKRAAASTSNRGNLGLGAKRKKP